MQNRRPPDTNCPARRRRASWAWALVVAVVVASPALGQDTPRVTVELERQQIYFGESVQYQVGVTAGGDIPEPQLEGFGQFDVQLLGRQSFMRRETVMGRGSSVRRGVEFVYRLTPKASGLLIIPPPTVQIDGKEYAGSRRSLEVIAPGEQDTVLMEISAEPATIYPTQETTVTLTVLVKELAPPNDGRSQLSLRPSRMAPPALSIPWVIDEELPEGLRPVTEWQRWIKGYQTSRGGFMVNRLAARTMFLMFDSEYLRFAPTPTRVQRRNAEGRTASYWQYRFERRFVARKTGTFTLGPVSFKGDMYVDATDDGKGVVKSIFCVASPATLEVKDVPLAGRPASYVGAIGRFTWSADIQPREAKVGDPLTLTLTLEGEGSLEQVVAPKVAALPEVADAFRIHESTDQVDGDTCTFTYAIRPETTDVKEFPSIAAAYFDVESGKYVTLKTDPIPLTIAAAQHLSDSEIFTARQPDRLDGAVELSAEGIFANITDLDEVRNDAPRGGRWLAAVAALAGLYVVASLLLGRFERLSGDPALVRRRGAAAKARRRLDTALAAFERQDARAGLDAVQSVFLGLAADAVDLPEAGLTAKEACAALLALNVDGPLVAAVHDLLQRCEAARYGTQDQMAGLEAEAQSLAPRLIEALKEGKHLR